MTKEQVQLLRDAGISETAIIDRILQETAQPVSPKAKPAEPAQPVSPKAKPAEPAPEVPQADPTPEPVLPDPKPARPGPTEGEDMILKAIEKLTGAIQARNVGNIGTETGGQETVEEILTNAFYK